mgnify:CR=1 FL=1
MNAISYGMFDTSNFAEDTIMYEYILNGEELYGS